MTDKRVFDLEVRKELKDTKQIMDKAVEDLTLMAFSKEDLIKENQELKDKIKHLEEMLLASKNIPDLAIRSHEEEIVRIELKRMYDVHVLKNIPLVDKDDIKKIKTLIECISIIKNGQKPIVRKEKEMSVEDALAFMRDETEKQ